MFAIAASLAGCAHYEPSPLRPSSVVLTEPNTALISADAQKIDRPYLAPEPINLSAPLTPNALAILAVLLLAALRYTLRWAPGRRIFDKLDESSAQVRVRFSVMILMGAAALAMNFGFEGILGTFVAGVVVGIVMRGDPFEHVLRSKLKVIGFGLFVPAFFVAMQGLSELINGPPKPHVGEDVPVAAPDENGEARNGEAEPEARRGEPAPAGR